MNKGKAYIICMGCLTAIFFCLLMVHAEPAAIPVGAVITGMVTITTAYIGLQVTNNGVIGKFYRPELDDRNRAITTATSGYAQCEGYKSEHGGVVDIAVGGAHDTDGAGKRI
jgi:hypothetical protein